MSLTLAKISETSTTITIGWTPPAGVAGYAFAANGQIVSVATAGFKDGTPRNSIRFSKTLPGPPFEVAAVCRLAAGGWAVNSGVYAGTTPTAIYPSASRYPSEMPA